MGISRKTTTSLYRKLLPKSVRRSSAAMRLKQRLLGHDGIYNADYYETKVEGPAVRSAGTMAASILHDLKPSSVVDVGCGTGALLERLRDGGSAVFGLEYAEAALNACRARSLDVEKFDLESDSFANDRTFDVAVSMEVAEHLPESVADRYVDLLASLAPVVVFTAATPGQGGNDHVNEQPHSYWIDKFGDRGFQHERVLSRRWSEDWAAHGDVEKWYYKNLMIFRRT